MHSDAGAPGGGACRVAFLEQGWLAVDPFSVKARPLLLGAPCSLCQRPVCVADACSVFYAKRFCLHCARANAAAFPPAVHKAAPAIFGAAAAAGGGGGGGLPGGGAAGGQRPSAAAPSGS
ncbi:hypothetical protein CHLRE_08g376900v5 [Chlamydomonas reinhardtii]|uniref:Cysteine-rich DPF motif domain-containing protein 1 n=1 Tax=Chlamydomonas reinhardtii TaxID=3055 RepID=A0A2K3DHS3_CHLRE|nr:uncharacterized protein CHLRE_08g376900v5 [Chlamydomonas reinhardtii]XP_042922189.1 uncharacterized protein CHLRE_08g376900v5 [Chlamydomonas reinhardtii]PNW80076.1 hypothetical protein CHLRE_08g376900v5 [Chlamydomonas reinhardtii]PNW80077.1 hypothetical protein CHLRE_08g376900v5 [Chlamydomonas reinhardtii]